MQVLGSQARIAGCGLLQTISTRNAGLHLFDVRILNTVYCMHVTCSRACTPPAHVHACTARILASRLFKAHVVSQPLSHVLEAPKLGRDHGRLPGTRHSVPTYDPSKLRCARLLCEHALCVIHHKSHNILFHRTDPSLGHAPGHAVCLPHLHVHLVGAAGAHALRQRADRALRPQVKSARHTQGA